MPSSLGTTGLGTEPGTGERQIGTDSGKILRGSTGNNSGSTDRARSGSTGGNSGSTGRARRLVKMRLLTAVFCRSVVPVHLVR